jgi:hypothetical protein
LYYAVTRLNFEKLMGSNYLAHLGAAPSPVLLVLCDPLLEQGFKSWRLAKQRTVVGLASSA